MAVSPSGYKETPQSWGVIREYMSVVEATEGMFRGWKFEPTVNLGHVFTILALLGGGLSVYVGVFQTLTELVLRVKVLENNSAGSEQRRIQLSQNTASIAELQNAVNGIRISNEKMLDALTGIRIDVGAISRRQTATENKP